MARKRPENEAVKALDSAKSVEQRSLIEAHLAQMQEEHLAKAREYCQSIGLARKEGEPYDEWVNRVRKHLRTTVIGRLIA